MGEMEGEGERNGRMGDWRGSGMGGEGFQAKRDGHRAPRGGWPVWLEIPIYMVEVDWLELVEVGSGQSASV